MEITKLTASQIASKLKNKEITSKEVVTEYMKKINEDYNTDKPINAFISFAEEQILRQADMTDKRLQSGEEAPLLGVPIGIKDNINIQDYPTTCASKILTGYISPFDAHVITQLRKAGAIFMGKMNMDEFAMGSSNEYSYYGAVRNPYDKSYCPGGSSGGSAAAVSSRFMPLALGSDTGGSVRQPASFCGTVGLKPTYGRVSRWGLVAFGSSLDQIGPFANSVKDVALLTRIIAGHDKNDSTSAPVNVPDYLKDIDKSISGKKIGIPKEYFKDGLNSEVRQSVEQSIELLKKAGCEVIEVSLPHTEYAIPAYYVCANAEASANLARYDGIRYGQRIEKDNLEDTYIASRSNGFGREVKRRILLGTFVLSSGYYDAYYKKALKVRTLIKQDFINAFEKVDLLVAPTSPTCAFKLGEKVNDPLQMYLSDIYTAGANLSGVPALSMPCGTNKSGLPIGLQFIGKHFDENTIFNIAYNLERELNTAFFPE